MSGIWADEQAFHRADPRRRQSAEVDLGATWRQAGSADAYRVAWLRDTGELYACKADSYDGSCSEVSVMAVVESEDMLDGVIFGWQEARHAPDGLDWLRGRLAILPAA